MNMECLECGEIVNPRWVRKHIYERHRLTVKQYYDKLIHIGGNCVECDEPAKFISISRGYRKTCGSVKCLSTNKIKRCSLGAKKRHELYPNMARKNGTNSLRKVSERSLDLYKKQGSGLNLKLYSHFRGKFRELDYEPDIGLGYHRKPDFLINGSLVVELHGGLHNIDWKQKQDARKKKLILDAGYKYLVIWNEELEDLDKVHEKIITNLTRSYIKGELHGKHNSP